MTTPDPVTALYHRLIDAWNQRDADAMAACFAPEGTMLGFDGSTACGPGRIRDHLATVFRDHPTPAVITVVRENRALGRDVGMLRAIVGMLPLGASDIN